MEANVIMIAACAPTLHPVYDQVRQKLVKLSSRREASSAPGPPSFDVAGPCRHDGSDMPRDRHKHTPKISDKGPGFWTAIIGQNSLTSSTLTTQRTNQTRSSRDKATVPVGSAANECQGSVSLTSTVPMRTLEDAVNWEGQGVGLQSGLEGGVDKAQLKLYHALQSSK